MKINITEDVIGEITTLTYLAMKAIIQKTAAKEEEKELFIHLSGSKLSPRDRVLTYLANTKMGVTTTATHRTVIVENEFLRHRLGISVYAMRAIRDELLLERLITVIGSAPKRIKFTATFATPAAKETTKSK